MVRVDQLGKYPNNEAVRVLNWFMWFSYLDTKLLFSYTSPG